MDIFFELTAIVVLSALLAFLMKLLKQPLIVGYILTGLLCGPYFFNIIQSTPTIELFSKLGITILLFIVGLSLSPSVIREVGKVSLATGIGQVVFTSLIGFIISLLLGIDRVAALYVSIALTFSSTIIILKLLSDKGDLNALYGKIAIGFLLVQDLIATIILLVVSSFTSTAETNYFLLITITILKGISIGLSLLLISQHILPRFLHFIARSQELLFLFSISWGMCLASVFYLLGFSVEIGALVAGVVLATTPFSYEIGARLKPLRDFFILLFFILLGSQMVLDNLASLLVPALVLSFFVLIGNPLIVFIIMNFLGFSRKAGFQSGLAVAQISEFSLILATLGFNLGHLSQEVLSLITLVGLITIAGSTYLILYDTKIFPYISRWLGYLEFRKHKTHHPVDESYYEVILFGYHRVGQEFVQAFYHLNKPFLVVDYNPDSIKDLELAGIPCRYGDVEDVEFLDDLHFQDVCLIVSTIPSFLANQLLLRKVREVNQKAIVILISHNAQEALTLYEQGATYVITPHYLGAQVASKMISKFALDASAFDDEKEKHIQYIYKHLGRSGHIPHTLRLVS